MIQKSIMGQVDLTIFPDALPGASADAREFYLSIVDAFGSSLDMRKIRSNLPGDASMHELTPEAVVKFSLENDKLLELRGGVLRNPDDSGITRISRMTVGSQSVSAVVSGTTDQALFLCKALIALLWKATGVVRDWQSIEPFVEYIGYKSTTLVDLTFPLVGFLSPNVTDFLRDSVTSGIGREMGQLPVEATKRQEHVEARRSIVHCREIRLVVSTMDLVAGTSEDCDLAMLIHSRSDANRSAVYVTSELPHEKHVKLANELIRRASPLVQ